MKFNFKSNSISRKISGSVVIMLIIFTTAIGFFSYYQALNAVTKELSGRD